MAVRVVLGGIGTVGLVVLWQVVGDRGWLGRQFAPPSKIMDTLRDPVKRRLIRRAVDATADSALRGFVIGVLVAVIASTVALTVPLLRPGLHRLAAVLQAVPIIALAPLFIVTVGRSGAPAAISALASSFPMFVASSAAFSAAKSSHLDVLHVLGATTVQRATRVQLPSALPGLFDGLRLAAPGAVLGALLGEWFGAPRGLGILMVNAMQNYQIPLLWTVAVISAGLSMAAYGAFSAMAALAGRRYGR